MSCLKFGKPAHLFGSLDDSKSKDVGLKNFAGNKIEIHNYSRR